MVHLLQQASRLLQIIILLVTIPQYVVPTSLQHSNNIKPPGYTKLVQSMLEQSMHQVQSEEIEFLPSLRVDDRRVDDRILNLNSKNKYHDKTQKLRLYFETSPIEQTISSMTDEALKEVGRNIVDESLPTIAKEFEEAISIQPFAGIRLSNTVCYNLFNTYFAEEATKEYLDVDAIIFVSAFNIINGEQWCNFDNSQSSTLAAATPCSLSRKNERPVVGFINVCLNAIQSKLERTQDVNDVMSHEILHILILNSELFKYYRNSVEGEPLTGRNWFRGFNTDEVKCVNGKVTNGIKVCENTIALREEILTNGDGSGFTKTRPYYEITLPTVRQVSRNQFNCQSLTGARLENQPTNPNDCTGSHFDERYFFSNIMSAAYIFGSVHFSPLLLALMEDSGWYKANYRIAENGSFGLNAGCDFVNKDCIVNGDVPGYSEGYFCNDFYDFRSQYRCGPTRTYRGRCDLARTSSFNERTYFDSSLSGPMQFILADWCPLVHLDREICSDDSKCLEVTLDETPTALCVESFCNDETKQFVFQLGNSLFPCNVEDKGRKIQVRHLGRLYEFVCPNLNQVCPNMFCPAMCSGKGICKWDAKPTPVCECFDPDDKSNGCFDSDPVQPGDCKPTTSPTASPTSHPSSLPTTYPSDRPSSHPTKLGTDIPSSSMIPTLLPSNQPSIDPSSSPSLGPTGKPSFSSLPTISKNPSFSPTDNVTPTSFDTGENQYSVRLSRGHLLRYSSLLCFGTFTFYAMQLIFL